ncbi:MAG: YicC family protein [Treponema sp.]|nr:YicC family protein [Treponema sp.]
MTSMTGYAYEEKTTDAAVVSVEIKSVNSRFLDLSVNLPSYLNPIESYFRGKISDKVARGKVDVYIRIKETHSEAAVEVDTELAKSYMKAYNKTIKAVGLPVVSPDAVFTALINQEGILNSNHDYDVEKYKAMIDPVFDAAFERFLQDKEREGANMKKDLLEKLGVLEGCAAFFKEWQPKMEGYFKEQITAKFNELLGENADQNRIMTETAAMLVKYTINEEIVRLCSHIGAMKTELNDNPVPGKRLDFICQEMNREINTIGSKNQFAEVGAMVINAKDALENIREQSKNVE